MLKYPNCNSLHAAGQQGKRIPGNRTEFTLTLDLFDANSPRYHVVHWGYGSNSMEQVHKCTGVYLIFDKSVYPVDKIVQWLTPPRKLQERLGGVVIRRRSADAQEDFQEKLTVAYALLENADPELLSLFWLTLLELNLTPPRRANTSIMTDAKNGRTGVDYAQAANHDKNTQRGCQHL